MNEKRVTAAEQFARLHGALLLLADALVEALGIYRLLDLAREGA